MSNYSIKYVIDAQNKLSPIFRKLTKELKALEKIAKGLAKPIKMRIDTRQMRTELNKIKKMAVIRAKISANLAAFKRQLSTITSKPITIRVHLDLTRAKQQLRALQGRMTRVNQGGIPSAGGAPPATAGQRSTPRREGRTAGAVAGGIMIASGVQDALTMDQAMISLEKATNAASDKLMQLKQMAIDMESQAGKSAAGFVNMITEASKAGVATENLTRVVQDGAMVATAWDMSIEEASDGLTGIRSGLYASISDFQKQQDAVMQTAATISYLADKTEASERYLANYIGRTSGLVTAFGQSEDAVNAAGAAFEAINIAPEVAARAMNSAAASFGAFIKKIKSDSPILKKLGMSQAEVIAATNKDMVGMIFQLVKATEGMDNMARTGVMAEIFGVGFADELIRLGSALPLYTRNLELLSDKTKIATTLQEQQEIQAKSLTAAWGRFVEGLKTVRGEATRPYLEMFTQGTVALVEIMKKYPIVADFGMAVAFVGVSLGIAALAATFVTAATVLLVAQLALLLVIFVNAYNNSESLRTALESLGIMLGKIAESFGLGSEGANRLDAAFMGIGIAASIVVELVTQIINGIATLIQVIFKLGTGDFAGAWNSFNDGVMRAEDSVKRLASSIKNDLQGTSVKINTMRTDAGLADLTGAAGGLADLTGAALAAEQRDKNAADAAKKLFDQQVMLTKKQDDAATRSLQASDALIQAASRLNRPSAITMPQPFFTLGANR